MRLEFEEEFRKGAPYFKALLIEADVVNGPTSDELWAELERLSQRVHDSYEMAMVNKRPAIAATRQAYKTFGKEPNRYRPSSEALCRRMVKGLELYRTLTIIDLINMVSVASGHSIGGFDGDKIDGDTLTLGVGREGEPYEAIGRGQLNIAGMPVWRDKIGGVGTPTSDNDRTKLSEQTKHLVMIVNIYGDEMDLDGLIDFTMQLLEKYASAENIKFQIFTP